MGTDAGLRTWTSRKGGQGEETLTVKFRAALSRGFDFAAGATPAGTPNCVRLLSLAGGAKADSAGTPLDLGVLPAPEGGVARVCSPSIPAPVAFPGVRGRRVRSGRTHRSVGADGLDDVRGFPTLGQEAVRVCSTVFFTSGRAAVIGVTSHADATATPSVASGLTAVPAHNPPRSAGRAAASPSEQASRSDSFAQRASGEAFVPSPARPPSSLRPLAPLASLSAARPADPPASVHLSSPVITTRQPAFGSSQSLLAVHPRQKSAARTTHLRTTTQHLRTNGSGPEDQLAHTAAGPKDRTHLSNRKD